MKKELPSQLLFRKGGIQLEYHEVMTLLGFTRHEWMNRLQLLHSYSKLGKDEKVQEKIEEAIHLADEERKLSNLNIPETFVWILSFNWTYSQFRITFQVQESMPKIWEYDKRIRENLEAVVDALSESAQEMELYEGLLHVKTREEEPVIEMSFVGTFTGWDNLQQIGQKDYVREVKIESLPEKKSRCTIVLACNI
jgi:stage 0 sporulation protein B (sporulation initiation phosphotransferase)